MVLVAYPYHSKTTEDDKSGPVHHWVSYVTCVQHITRVNYSNYGTRVQHVTGASYVTCVQHITRVNYSNYGTRVQHVTGASYVTCVPHITRVTVTMAPVSSMST
uniref:Uncharacterized protein n=1 Tax=Branchiostoma floridae TaxID=7739 RepID=C3ZUQ1_BRAFL|eukprot:XP_002587752.1 hypothetical protein BRAFLDRAFT_94656 [Branchiostoma floridae]